MNYINKQYLAETFKENTDNSASTTTVDAKPSDGSLWWRTPCHVTGSIVVSGDLHHKFDEAVAQIHEWVDNGVTAIIDCRGEYSDKKLVAEVAPDIDYFYHGTHDSGGSQTSSWYTRGGQFYQEHMEQNPEGKVMVHCHMGVNRAPSMAMFLMMLDGHEPVEALKAIRKARPIARILYADSAWRTYAGVVCDASEEDIEQVGKEIDNFFTKNKMNTSNVIRQIRLVEHE